jgi:hypothetical protein
LVFGGPLGDPEIEELDWLYWRNSDEKDQLSVVDVVLGHCWPITLHEESLIRRVPA